MARKTSIPLPAAAGDSSSFASEYLPYLPPVAIPIPAPELELEGQPAPGPNGPGALPTSSPWSVTLSGGPLLSDAAAAYGGTDDLIGAVASARLTYALTERWYGSIGLQRTRLRFLTAASFVDTVRESRPGQLIRVIRFGEGDPIREFADSIDVERTRVLRQYARQTAVSAPIVVGARWQRGRLWYGVQAGALVGIRRGLRGRLVGDAGEVRIVEEGRPRWSIRPMLGVETGVWLRGRWGVRAVLSGYRAAGLGVGGLSVGQAEVGLRWGW